MALTKSQMAPQNQQSVDAVAGKDFFSKISRDGYPSSNAKTQPWKSLWTGAQGKDTQADGKMIVACALRHDYGMQYHLYLRVLLLTTHRVKWSRGLLAMFDIDAPSRPETGINPTYL